MEIAPKQIGVQTKLAEECFRQTDFIEIPLCGGYGHAQNHRTDRIKLWRAGKEQVFHGGGLKNAVVGGMQQEIPGGNEIGEAQTRTERCFIEDEGVIVEADASAEIPVTVMHLVLHVKRRLNVPFLFVEQEMNLGAGIKLRRIRDAIYQSLVNRRKE